MHKRKRSKEREEFEDSYKSLKKLDNESLASLMSNLYLSENSCSQETELPYQPTRTLPSYFYKKEYDEEIDIESDEETDENHEEIDIESDEEIDIESDEEIDIESDEEIDIESETDLDSLIGQIPNITEFHETDIETIYDSDTDTEKSIDSSLTPFFIYTTDEEDSEKESSDKEDLEIPIKFSNLEIK